MTIIKDIHKDSQERHLYKLTVIGEIDFKKEILVTEFWPFQKTLDNHLGLRFYIDRLIVKRDLGARSGDVEVNHAWLYLMKEEITGPPNYYLKHTILIKGAWQIFNCNNKPDDRLIWYPSKGIRFNGNIGAIYD